MGIFNIQSLKDKYLSDSGVPAEQDGAEPSSTDASVAERRRSAQGSSQGTRSSSSQARPQRGTPVASRMTMRSARDTAVAEAAARRRAAAERAQAQQTGQGSATTPGAEAHRHAQASSPATAAQRTVGGQQRRPSRSDAPQTQSMPLVRKTKSITIGEFHGVPSKKKKKSQQQAPSQKITQDPQGNSARLDRTVVMDPTEVQAAADRYTAQRQAKKPQRETLTPRNPRVQNTSAQKSGQKNAKPARAASSRPSGARAQTPGASTKTRRPQAGSQGSAQRAGQRSASAQGSAARGSGSQGGRQPRPKSSIAKNPAARHAALKNTVRSNLARQANEQMAQQQTQAQQNPEQQGSAQQTTAQRRNTATAQQQTSSQQTSRQQSPQPAESGQQNAQRQQNSPTQSLATSLNQASHENYVSGGLHHPRPVAHPEPVKSAPGLPAAIQPRNGLSPAEIVAAARARAHQNAPSNEDKPQEGPKLQGKLKAPLVTETPQEHNPWGGAAQKAPAAHNPWGAAPVAQKKPEPKKPANPWGGASAAQTSPSPSVAKIQEKLTGRKPAKKPEKPQFDMEKLLQPGYQPQTRKEAIAIRHAREEMKQREEEEERRRQAEKAQQARSKSVTAQQDSKPREETPYEREKRKQQAQRAQHSEDPSPRRATREDTARESSGSNPVLNVRESRAGTTSPSITNLRQTQPTSPQQAPARSTAPVRAAAPARPARRASHASPFKLAPGEVRSGVVRRRRLAPRVQGTMEAIFVCTGNVARSAAAEIMARQLSEEYGLTDDWIFSSAGTAALSGSRVYRLVAKQLDERGYNVSGYRAKQLTEDMVERATLLLVAEADHADWIIREWPQYHHKVHLMKQVARLKEQAGENSEPLSYIYSHNQAPEPEDNIDDPYRQGKEAARVAVDEVENSLFEILPWLAHAQVRP